MRMFSLPLPSRGDKFDTKQHRWESEASRHLRIGQLELEEAVKAKDPNYQLL